MINELINLSLICGLLYFIINILFEEINFFIWLFKNKNKIWIINILIHQANEPEKTPLNIKKRKKIKGNLPHKLKSSVTYPVPDKIETTLKVAILNLAIRHISWLLKSKYTNMIIEEITNK